MKKLALLVLVMALLLTGCGSSANKEAGNAPETTPTTQATEAPQQEPAEAPEEEIVEEATEAPQFPADPILAEPAKLPTGYTLTEIGTISNDDLGFRSDDVIILRDDDAESDDERDKLLDQLGNVIGDGYLRDVTKMTDEILAVSLVSDTVNSTGLVAVDGEVLIPFEAAFIKPLRTDIDDATFKYLNVIYSTGVTENEDEAFFFITDRIFAMSVEEDDELHTGYSRIYDLENRRFMDFTITDPGSSVVHACGDYLMVEDSDYKNIYDDQGNLIGQFNGGVSMDWGWNYVITSSNGLESVCGCDGTVYFTSKESLSPLSPEYIQETIYEGDTRHYAIRDIYGNLLFEVDDERVSKTRYGAFHLSYDEEDVLLNHSGEEIFRAPNYLTHEGYGYWSYYLDEGDGYVDYLLTPEGVVHTCDSLDDMVAARSTDPGYEFYVFNDKDFTMPLNCSYFSVLQPGLIEATVDNRHGVYDLFSGEELLPPLYRRVYYAYGNLYAYKDDVWTVFKINLEK